MDELLDDWARERPDLDFTPVAIVTRLARVRAHLDSGVGEVFARYDLSPADFQVIVTLRRAGRPYRLAQARLMNQLALSSGTISVRIDRLAKRGVVVRESDPDDARLSLVRLTDGGVSLFDAIAPAHLANEDRLLSALDGADRSQLADLLRRLLVSFEHATVQIGVPLGLRLEHAHRARQVRIAAGLSDTPGLLVAETIPGTPAARAGIAVGDLLVELGGRAIRNETGLQQALRAVLRHRPAEPADMAGAADSGRLETVALRLMRANDLLNVTLSAPAALVSAAAGD